MGNTKELSDMKAAAEQLLLHRICQRTGVIAGVIPDIINRSRIDGKLVKDILTVFQIDADDSRINNWTSEVLRVTHAPKFVIASIPAPFDTHEFDFGRSLIDLCCKVKSGEINQDDFWGKKGIHFMKTRLLKKHT